MREQEEQFNSGRDPETTVLKPLFDEDATEVARPVIPLDDREVTEGMGAYVETGTAPPAYTRAWKRRNQWTVALVLAALFAGTVTGIAGLYLYQRSRTSQASSVPATEAPATAEASQPATPGAAPAAPSPANEASAPAAEGEAAAGSAEAAKGTVKASSEEEATRRTERAAARRSPSNNDVSVVPVKRGKKGDDDDAAAVEPERTRPRVYDTQGSAPEGSAAARRAAREEERMRRMRRERRRRGEAYMVDSIRGIFEGGRESPPR